MEQFTIYYGTPEGKAPKIGVDSSYPNRLNKQKIHDGRVLEVHTCVYEASRREIELQREYGVKVDCIPYHVVYFKNKSTEQRVKTSITLRGNTNARGQKGREAPNKGKFSTTPEFDMLVIQDFTSGMSYRKTAKKHNISQSIVGRIIRNMNEQHSNRSITT